jgi:hypothetical protein
MTLYELEKAICKFLSVESFSKLTVGPLHENSLVRELFQLHDQHITTDDLELNKLTYLDLFRYLRKYLDDQKLWSYNKLDLNEFNVYLKDKLKLPYLPIRINNISLMIASIKNVKRIYYDSLNKCFTDFETEIKSFYIEKYSSIRTNLELKFTNLEDVANIGDMNTIDLIKEFFYLFQLFYSNDYNASNPNETEFYCISEFFNLLKQNTYLSELFHLILCFIESKDIQSNLIKSIGLTSKNKNRKKKFFKGLLRSLMRLIVDVLNKSELKGFLKDFLFDHNENERFHIIFDKDISRKHVKFTEPHDETATVNDPADYLNDFNNLINNVNGNEKNGSFIKPNQNELINKISEYLAECQNQMTVENLQEVEIKICTFYNVQNFDMLGVQSFLRFLLTHRHELKFDLQSQRKTTLDRNHRQFMNRFFLNRNANASAMSSTEKIFFERILCNQFCLNDLNDLGYKSVDSLISNYKSDHIDDNENQDFFYENLILNEYSFLEIDPNHQVLIDLIEKCPLLANLNDYLQWNLLYTRKYGDLKDFISHKTTYKCVEIERYKILKLASHTDLNQLKDSLLKLDPHMSAAHLLSLVTVVYRSLSQAPLALLTNEFEYLFRMMIGADDQQRNQFYRFFVKFLCFLPLRFSSNCLFSLFIEPLVKVEGSLTFVKESILKILKNFGSVDECRYFYHLSSICLISEWSDVLTATRESSEFQTNPFPIEKSIKSSHDAQNQNQQTLKSDEEVQILQIQTESAYQPHDAETSSLANDGSNQEFIENIRKNKYGIGLELTSENEFVMKSLKKEISSCLRALSNELYNKDMHFVLELIQNADDNQYSSTENPTIIFLIENNSITLFNNELGFQQKNVEAICAVGASTKGKHKHGYIGRKGWSHFILYFQLRQISILC